MSQMFFHDFSERKLHGRRDLPAMYQEGMIQGWTQNNHSW